MSQDKIRASMEAAENLYMGASTSCTFNNDPKHLVFTLARYKFVAKMLQGYESVLEVGCGDAFASTLVSQVVKRLVCIDSEPYVATRFPSDNAWLKGNTTLEVHDFVDSPMPERFQAVFCLDVIEHIPPEQEDRFMANMEASSLEHGVLCIVGTPNITASEYASKNSEIGHINLKSHDSLKETMSRSYRNVFMFGMNDEVLHTGFAAMSHYLIALCTEPYGPGLNASAS